jgi:outer membrane protein OmpA-like peptidoglycan-associated protein
MGENSHESMIGRSMSPPAFQFKSEDEPEGIEEKGGAGAFLERTKTNWGNDDETLQSRAATSWGDPIQAKAINPIQRKDADEESYKKFIGQTYKWDNFTAGLNGKFDVVYNPSAKQVDINVKVRFQFPWSWAGIMYRVDGKDDAYRAQYINDIQTAWSNRYSFNNVRAPQKVWSRLNPTTVNVNVNEVDKGEHFLIDVDPFNTGRAQVSGGVTKMYKGDESPNSQFNPQTGDGELKRFNRVNPSPVLFGSNSAAISPADKTSLDFLATYAKRINNPTFDITISGHSNTVSGNTPKGQQQNQKLSEDRADAVDNHLKTAGMTNHNVVVKGEGQKGADATPAWRKATIVPKLPAGWQNMQATSAHEFGHMVGLGDEYGGGGGAVATHHALTQKALGKKYSDQVAKRGDTDYASIMEGGDDVRIQHYVTFWDALAQTTTQKAAEPNPKFGHADWKFIG